ncbi:cell division protein [Endozoicomonas sp. OPT23]|uniref:peptidoglycan D,D-transpeptidase FtsI family protein n=1 Tax=Endozoicomonas sp. OPT23 TaxID=2072845 RepID=UPI00129B286A|nr:penicillin-binding transpeptidase domain-containing protein [Endozoicomonas sp. OPT23]MRI35384.1 cell division protein [Endozoicomonas sp. OPT23]
MNRERTNSRTTGSSRKKEDEEVSFKGRFRFIQAIFVMLGIIVTGQLVNLQILDRQFLQGEGDKRSVRNESIPAHRGIIFDRNGKILAASAPVTSVWADPVILLNSKERWFELADALDLNRNWLTRRLNQKAAAGKRFLPLKRELTPEEGKLVRSLRIKGIVIRPEQKRYYPMGEVTSHLIGLTGRDDKDAGEIGKEGLELGYDQWLTGSNGSRRIRKDLLGNLVTEAELLENSQPGKELMLSIDSRLQYMAYRELKSAVKKHRAKSGSLVMLDVQTGEVLAMVNQPSYNPNNREELKYSRNRVLTDAIEPGSTLKPFTVAAALESGKYNRYTRINTGVGYMRVGRDSVKDTHGYGVIDVETVLKKSSNIGVTKMALNVGADSVMDMFRRVGLGQSPGTGFPGERSGYIPYKDRFSDIETATLSFGYGLTVTPMQLAQAYAVLGAGGVLRPTSLIKRDVPPAGKRVMPKEVADEVLQMLGKVVRKGGTGWRGAVKSYDVAAKTGTVRKVSNRGYSSERYIGLFAGVAPLENPRIATVVIIDDPAGKDYYGGVTAGPVFSKVNAQALRALGVRPQKDKVLTAGLGLQNPAAHMN